jgi:hypothetical protein
MRDYNVTGTGNTTCTAGGRRPRAGAQLGVAAPGIYYNVTYTAGGASS